MKVTVVGRSPAQVRGDVVVQFYRLPLTAKTLPLREHLRPGAVRLVTREDLVLTWLESRDMSAPRVLMVCLGSAKDRKVERGWSGAASQREQEVANRHVLRVLGAEVERACEEHDVRRVVIAPLPDGFDVATVVEGMVLSAYSATEFRPDDIPSAIRHVTVCAGAGGVSDVRQRVTEAVVMAESTNLARALNDLPGNVGNAKGIVSRVRRSATEVGLKARALGEKDLRRLGMGLFMGVAQGAGTPGALLLLEHNAARARSLPTLVFVGKGLTHDTGGYNIKTSPELHDLTYDKSGAMAVVGAMHAIARLQVEAHVVGVVPLVENCIDANAYKPGDILTAMDGTTVYVDNTDAEGRLVLADCLTYVERYQPDVVIDIATLTGACSVALGEPFAGLFSNDDDVRDLLLGASRRSGDLVWPMPIHASHVAALRHHLAQMRNAGSRAGGACSAAAFLRHFTRYPWAHIDMAGKGSYANERDYMAAGASGFGSRLLIHAAQDFAAGSHGKRRRSARA